MNAGSFDEGKRGGRGVSAPNVVITIIKFKIKNRVRVIKILRNFNSLTNITLKSVIFMKKKKRPQKK